ncbi:hypothetical protein Dalk_3187 [Desulfatibacillum aliphaticivorans]|uniref:DUF2971 domain-containing protein n=1 Tax=Desulfatibacillum aliphaticivorans TaxID=218208 RepID=B8FGG8_DESAL|nr:DUF2971 domain-containing protein [Desulfatibacillum aliphaticivorans]ACL04877.1 hypothetical protein Dalk_3187 [Desulfatibacillum aliphaticivorans]
MFDRAGNKSLGSCANLYLLYVPAFFFLEYFRPSYLSYKVAAHKKWLPQKLKIGVKMTSPNRLHDRDVFYKYTSHSTSLKIIKNQSLRWSSPSIFNDPFDVPKIMYEGIDIVDLRMAAVKVFCELLIRTKITHFEYLQPRIKYLIEAIGDNDEIKKEIIEDLEQHKKELLPDMTGFQLVRDAWESMYEDNRILCLSEFCDSASMWDRYSETHKGVVFELGCIDEIDSPWLVAKPVSYSDAPLFSDTPEGLAEILLYNGVFAARKILEEYLFTKTTDWSYEKEWRIATTKRHHEGGSYSDWSVHPANFIAIILGMNMGQEERKEVIEMSRKYLPNMIVRESFIETGRKISIRNLT